jgi:D-cysteine desulfhydrase family pyridoxal phosphate-dependent enzyme
MRLEDIPRYSLATLPTPLQEAKNLRQALGGENACPRILIKRDDLTGLALGGNKVRKLEFLVADAIAQGATVLVTSGAVQSNHARQTAAAARVAGLKTVLVLSTRYPDPPLQGNLLLDSLLGAEVHIIPQGESEDEKINQVIADLTAQGEKPYLIPVGGSNGVGSLGYVTFTAELLEQLTTLNEIPTWLYYPAGSRGTQAGLALGAKYYNAPYRLCGVAVSPGEPEKLHRAANMVSEAVTLFDSTIEIAPAEFTADPHYIGEGYGIITPACVEAIKMLAIHEGIFLDPVYTGKAMAGLIDHIRQSRFSPTETVVFLHTGGAPALFAYAAQLV